MNILTVSQINFYVKSLMDSDKVLSNFYYLVGILPHDLSSSQKPKRSHFGTR